MHRRSGAHGAGWLSRLLHLAGLALGAITVAALAWLLITLPLWWSAAPRLPLPAVARLATTLAPPVDMAGGGALQDVVVRHLDAELDLKFAGPWAQWLYLFFAVQELVLLTAALLLLRHIVDAVATDDAFGHANVRRLRWLGLVLLVEAMYAPGISSALSGWLLDDVTMGGAPLRVDWSSNLGTASLVGAWIVFILSEAFRQGAVLRDEQNLTV